MKPRTYILLSLLDTCLAQSWKLDGACSQYADSIAAAFKEAVSLAETASDVIANNYGTDPHIQQMVKYILGDDADLQAKVDIAKGIFEGVKTYEKDASPFLGTPFIANKDLLIFCDLSNYDKIKSNNGEFNRNKASGSVIPDQHWSNFVTCYDPNAKAGGSTSLPMAITTSSDYLDSNKYQVAVQAWKAAGATGPQPDPAAFRLELTTKPNTMDLCMWFLADNQNSKWPKVDTEMIAKVQDPAFIAGLKGNDKAVDSLSQTLGATFLHELTHTNLGGRTLDNQSQQGCYGWVCIGALHDPHNADSINMLGVALTIWKLGFYVDNNGLIQKLP